MPRSSQVFSTHHDWTWAIIYKDDLRLMALKPVAAKEGAMKEKQDNKPVMFIAASNSSCQDSLLYSCPIDRQLNAKWFPARRSMSGQWAINQRWKYEGGIVCATVYATLLKAFTQSRPNWQRATAILFYKAQAIRSICVWLGMNKYPVIVFRKDSPRKCG